MSIKRPSQRWSGSSARRRRSPGWGSPNDGPAAKPAYNKSLAFSNGSLILAALEAVSLDTFGLQSKTEVCTTAGKQADGREVDPARAGAAGEWSPHDASRSANEFSPFPV